MRLVNGSGQAWQGRVEMLQYGTFLPLCSDSLTPRSAALLCRQLGYVGGYATLEAPDTYGTLPASTTSYVEISNDFFCEPGSPTLEDCGSLRAYALSDSPCGGAAALTCSNSTGPAPTSLTRLTGSSVATSGRVELFANSGVWAGVAAATSSTPATIAQVVCNSLGYPKSVVDASNTFSPRADAALEWSATPAAAPKPPPHPAPTPPATPAGRSAATSWRSRASRPVQARITALAGHSNGGVHVAVTRRPCCC